MRASLSLLHPHRFFALASCKPLTLPRCRFPLSLQKRVEYLSLAVGNAKSQQHSSSSSRGDAVQFLTDVEEKLEVAQVQIEIFRAIEEGTLPSDEKQAWLEKVEERLFTITEVRLCSRSLTDFLLRERC